MARASTWAWVGVAAGMALGGTASASSPVLGLAALVAQAPVRPSTVHGALNAGIDCYRRGDYEQAAALFQKAQAGQDDLSQEEREELANVTRRNAAAMRQRRDGAEQLRRAEFALHAGRSPEADAILKTVTANQFLTAADQARAQRLAEQLRGGAPRVAGNQAAVPPAVLARTKLQQARLLMAKSNFDAAEALARETEQLHVAYGPGEDTPTKVIEDVHAARTDGKALLAASRAALQAGELDRAEELARTAQANSNWSFPRLFGDSPAKVLKDVQAARSRAGVAGGAHGGQPGYLSPAEAAREMVKEGRRALQRGDVEQARDYATQAQSLGGDFHWWEDNPSKLGADVKRAADRLPASAQGKGRDTSSLGHRAATQGAKEDPRAALVHARELLAAGKVDEAQRAAERLRTNSSVQWGLFDDSPERLLADVAKARSGHGQDEAARLMAQARQLSAQGRFEEAKALAFRAERVHGPYSIWETADRPSKLVAEITLAQAKARKAGGPADASRDTQVAQAKGQAEKSAGKPSELKLTSGSDAGAPAPAVFNQPSDQPAPAIAGAPALLPAGRPEADGAKARALELVRQARELQKQDRLVQARQKALEAQKLAAGADLGADGPDLVLLRLADAASKRVEALVQEATDYAATGSRDPARYERADADLRQALEIASGFGLDTQPVAAKAAWVRSTREDALRTASSEPRLPSIEHAPAPVASESKARPAGSDLLDKARLELSKGELETARRLAVEAYNGPPQLRAEADAVLHSIDAEEYGQRVLASNRSFDAAVAAYCRKDYAQAASILHGIDTALLSKEKQAKLKELMLVPELRPSAVAQASAMSRQAGDDAEPGRSTATDAPAAGGPEGSYAQQVHALQEIQFQKLRDEGLRAQREATDRFRAGEPDQALEILQDYLDGLRDTPFDGDRLALLRRPVEARLQQFRTLKAQQAFEKMQTGRQETFAQMKSREEKVEEHKQHEVGDLMKQYHDLYKQGKYKEAEMAAMRAHELDPDNVDAAGAVHVAHVQRAQTEYSELKGGREDHVRRDLNEAEDEGPVVTSKEPLDFDKERWEVVKNRKGFPVRGVTLDLKTDREREIEHRLTRPVTLDFKDTPLRQVIDDLRDLTGINIVADQPALDEENISLDRPITMHVETIAAKSALNLVLHQAHLIYVVKDEVLQVTTEAHARGKLVQTTYQVADLVVPVDDHTIPNSMNIEKVLEQQNHPQFINSNTTPYTGTQSLGSGNPVGATTAATSAGSAGGISGSGLGRTPGKTLEDVLIKMITNTIKPESWVDMGGQGTIEYYPLGMALVVSQTPDIQEQIAELLQALRRLQDLEMTVEVRFITIDESFYERMGLDFNVNIVTDQNTKLEPQLLSGQFAPFGFNNVLRGNPNFVTGIQQASGGNFADQNAMFTPDLNIPLKQNNFNMAFPPFGGYPQSPPDGGLTLGLAFLSDIQVFLFLEAAQGDMRTNVMQAPKLTLFNGQTSTINITTNAFFVTSVAIGASAGQIFYVPTNTTIPFGVTLTIQGIVSADRRFVRLNMAPTVTQITTSVPGLFPITSFIVPAFENGSQGVPIPFTQFLQQPTFQAITVNTTVNVPDGGTVVMGGLKTMREGRNEFGPPFLSKIPYINRLFKNVGYGRETESLLIMVTPRVVINEEEEIRQTGVGATPAAGAPGAPAP